MPPPKWARIHRVRRGIVADQWSLLKVFRSCPVGPGGSQYKVYYKWNIEHCFNKRLEDSHQIPCTTKLVNVNICKYVPVNKLFYKASVLFTQTKHG